MRELVEVTLYTEVISKDRVGQSIRTRSDVKIQAIRSSISQSEFFSADQSGIRPDFKLDIYSGDYSGQTSLSVDGNDYTIYRTYSPRRDRIELYVGERVGDQK